jgi:hypothetical protein
MPNEPVESLTKAERAAAARAVKRAELEAAALRANLRRRKAQSRAREAPVPEGEKPCR